MYKYKLWYMFLIVTSLLTLGFTFLIVVSTAVNLSLLLRFFAIS